MTADPTFWDKIARDYAARPLDDPAAFERKIEVMKRLLGPTDTVLDIGCGTGSLVLRLAPFAAQVHGLDLSSEMVGIARDKASAQGAANVTFHVGPFDESLSVFPAESLDGVSACSLLHLVEDRARALAGMFRLLKPGGFFVTSTVCLGESWIPYSPLLTVMRWIGKAPRVWVLTKDELAAEIGRAGFVDLQAPDVGANADIGIWVARRPASP